MSEAPTGAAWPDASFTGVGSMPGADPREAARVVLGEVAGFPFLPELPARGAGADMLGRTLALLPGVSAATVPTGWRLGAPGADERRALSMLGEDLDTVEELAAGADGPFKVALVGPLTLAAGVELASGERALRDHGATRDLAAALAEAVRDHVADVRRRLPGARVVLQLDEPSLPAVLDARVPTASGLATLRRVEESVAETHLSTVLAAARAAGATTAVHCCAPLVPVDLLRRAGADAVGLDLTLVGDDPTTLDALAHVVDDGAGVLAGVVPTDGGTSDVLGSVRAVRRWWRALGFAPERLGSTVALTPACGLAGRSWPVARRVLGHVGETARILAEDPEGER